MGKPKNLLLKDVTAAAQYLASCGRDIDDLGSDAPEVDKVSAEAIRDKAAEGAAALAEALEGGADAKDTAKYPSQDDSGNEVEAEITLGELQPFLQDTLRKADARILWLDMEQRAMNCHSYAEDGDKLNPDLADIGLGFATELVALVGKARAAGVPADKKMEFYGNSYTLDELKELGTYLAETCQKIAGTLDEEKKAADAPYLKGLKGDRKKVFEAEFAGMGGMWECLGAGGDALDTLKKLKDSDVWYVYGNSTTALIEWWRIRGWRFKGDKIAEHLSDEGPGLKPPESKFVK